MRDRSIDFETFDIIEETVGTFSSRTLYMTSLRADYDTCVDTQIINACLFDVISFKQPDIEIFLTDKILKFSPKNINCLLNFIPKV